MWRRKHSKGQGNQGGQGRKPSGREAGQVPGDFCPSDFCRVMGTEAREPWVARFQEADKRGRKAGDQSWGRVRFFWGDGDRHIKGAAGEPSDLQLDLVLYLSPYPFPTLLFPGSLASTGLSLSPQFSAQVLLALVTASNMFFWLRLSPACSPCSWVWGG